MKINSIIVILLGLLLLSGCGKEITAKPMQDLPPIQNQTISKPQPKELTFPEKIENYQFIEKTKQSDCDSLEEAGYPDMEICQENYRLQYQDEYNTAIFVIFSNIHKGLEQGKEYIITNLSTQIELINNQTVYRIEQHEFMWFPKSDFDMIATQEGKVKLHDKGASYSYGTASKDNPVFKHFLLRYPAE